MKTIQEEELDKALDILYSVGEVETDPGLIYALNRAANEIGYVRDVIKRRRTYAEGMAFGPKQEK